MAPKRPTLSCFLFSCVLATAVAASGSDRVLFEEQSLTFDPPDGGFFGRSLETTNATVLVGNTGNTLYTLERTDGGWERGAELRPADAPGDFFAEERAIDIDGDTVIAGAPFHLAGDTETGAVYVFERDAGGSNAWGQVLKLVPPDAEEFDAFGTAVAIDGNTLAVGATGVDLGGANVGATYVYDRDPVDPRRWHLSAKLSAGNRTFGFAVDLDGDRLVVGAGSVGVPPSSRPSWVFERNAGGPNAWGEVARLTPPGGETDDSFGRNVAIAERWVAVAAPYAEGGGAVYMFQRDADSARWRAHSKLAASAGTNQFGDAMAMGPTTLVVGDFSSFPQVAHAFRYKATSDTWREMVTLARSDGGDGAFGHAVGVTEDEVWVGAFASHSIYRFVPRRPLILSVEGVCGDPPIVTIRRASPNGSVELLSAAREGDSRIPVGPCQGVRTGLEAPARLLSVIADAGGEVSAALDVPQAACGPALQVLDTSSCETTEVATIDRLEILRDGKVHAPDSAPYDRFGNAIDVDADTAIVGTAGDEDSGSAWILERVDSEWAASYPLIPPEPEPLAELGHSTALAGDIAVLGGPGCPEYFNDPGLAWVFERDDSESSKPGPTPWVPVARLAASDAANRDRFGSSISADDDRVAIGAPSRAPSGATYVYQRDAGGPGAWGEVAKLEAPDGTDGDSFGSSVFLTADLLAIGAPGDDDEGEDSGSVYLFEEDPDSPGDWVLRAKLTASDGTRSDGFGTTVAIDGDRLAVGAPDGNADGGRVGFVYTFTRQVGTDVWTESTKLRPADLDFVHDFTGPRFGWSIDLDGPMLAVGESRDVGGEAYLFREVRGRWAQVAQIKPDDVQLGDNFGSAVALDGDSVLVGAPFDDDVDTAAGTVYALRWARPIAELSAKGGCPGELTLTARRATPHAPLALVWGTPDGSAPLAVAHCPAVALDLGEPTLAGFAVADPWGRAALTLSTSRRDCGRPVRLVDLATCRAADADGYSIPAASPYLSRHVKEGCPPVL